jgi:hypothetical protein
MAIWLEFKWIRLTCCPRSDGLGVFSYVVPGMGLAVLKTLGTMGNVLGRKSTDYHLVNSFVQSLMNQVYSPKPNDH